MWKIVKKKMENMSPFKYILLNVSDENLLVGVQRWERFISTD